MIRMTEKQFTHKKWLDDRQLFDGDEPFAIVDVYIQAEAICDKLNELNKEKEIAIDGIKIADELIKKYGSEELKHEWKKEVTAKYK